ncbi:permease prefix domain 1-containing protein [Alkalibacterium psychrotolerans]
MTIIKEYVNQVFKTVPLTEETNQLRLDITANMEDKYNELRLSGASEHEALGVVIAEFGNIDELLEEMGINKTATENKQFPPAMEEGAIDYFVQSKAKLGIRIGTGILTILAGIASLLFFLSLSSIFQAANIMGIILLLIGLAAGTALLVVEGMRSSSLEAYYKPFVLLPDSRERIEEEKDAYKKSLTFSIILGLSFSIGSFGPLFIGIFSNLFSVLVGVGLMLLLAGIGVVFFVYSGNVYHAYDVILQNGKEPDNFEEEVKADERRRKVDYIIDEIYWPIIVVLYLVFSFIVGGWAWTWLIFVIGGVLEDVIKGFLSSWE